jgi:hypothetical protein
VPETEVTQIALKYVQQIEAESPDRPVQLTIASAIVAILIGQAATNEAQVAEGAELAERNIRRLSRAWFNTRRTNPRRNG